MEHTIKVRCDIRKVISMAATESALMNAAVEMGLLSCLDKLAARALAITDPAARAMLRLLCLEDVSGAENKPYGDSY